MRLRVVSIIIAMFIILLVIGNVPVTGKGVLDTHGLVFAADASNLVLLSSTRRNCMQVY